MKPEQHYRYGKVGSLLFSIMKSLNHDEIISGLIHKNISMEHIRNQFVLSETSFNHLIIPSHNHYLLAFDEYRYDHYLCRTDRDEQTRTVEFFLELEKDFAEHYNCFFNTDSVYNIYAKQDSGYGYRGMYYFYNLIRAILSDSNYFDNSIPMMMDEILKYQKDLFMVRPRKRIANSVPKKYEEVETPAFLTRREVIFDMFAAFNRNVAELAPEDISGVSPSIFKKTKIIDYFIYVPATSYIACYNYFKNKPDEFGEQVQKVLKVYKSLTPEQRFAFVSILSAIGAVTKESADLFSRDRSTLVQEHFLKMMCINKDIYSDFDILVEPFLDLGTSYLSENFRIIMAHYGRPEWLPFLLGTNRMSVKEIVKKRMERGF